MRGGRWRPATRARAISTASKPQNCTEWNGATRGQATNQQNSHAHKDLAGYSIPARSIYRTPSGSSGFAGSGHKHATSASDDARDTASGNSGRGASRDWHLGSSVNLIVAATGYHTATLT